MPTVHLSMLHSVCKFVLSCQMPSQKRHMEKLKKAVAMAARVQKETLIVCTCLYEPDFISVCVDVSIREGNGVVVCLSQSVCHSVSMPHRRG